MKKCLWKINFILVLTVIITIALGSFAFADNDSDEDKSSSMQMMERIETIIYGEPSKGGLIERLGNIEKELFGRSLPGSIAERHVAILNFLEVGSSEQPSMLFKLGIAEWIVGQRVNTSKSAMKRLERLEQDLDGDLQYGKPVAMRVERILSVLVSDPIVFENISLPGNTVLKAVFKEELNPAKAKAGDSVSLELTNDLKISNYLIAPTGSKVNTVVKAVKKPSAFGQPSEIRLNFIELEPLGPQRPAVFFGKEARKAAEIEQKNREKGDGAIVGAGAASLAGAVLLGPVGLVSGLFIRGNAITIPKGSITFIQTSEDITVSAYPVPASLLIDPSSAIQGETGSSEAPAPSGDSDIIIKKNSNSGSVELPPEQKVH